MAVKGFSDDNRSHVQASESDKCAELWQAAECRGILQPVFGCVNCNLPGHDSWNISPRGGQRSVRMMVRANKVTWEHAERAGPHSAARSALTLLRRPRRRGRRWSLTMMRASGSRCGCAWRRPARASWAWPPAGRRFEALDRGHFDVVFLDFWLGADAGLTCCRRSCARQPDVGVIVVTAFASIESAVDRHQARRGRLRPEALYTRPDPPGGPSCGGGPAPAASPGRAPGRAR